MPDERSIPVFIEALGSSAPTPGGGAASALVGALAAALAEMVAQLTAGRKQFSAVESEARDVLLSAQRLRQSLLDLIAEDERAFEGVSTGYRLPKVTDEERALREEAIQAALHDAMQPPLAVMRQACEAAELAERIARAGNPTVASDAGCAALFAESAVHAAALNVLANVVLLRDTAAAAAARAQIAELSARATELRAATLATVYERMGA